MFQQSLCANFTHGNHHTGAARCHGVYREDGLLAFTHVFPDSVISSSLQQSFPCGFGNLTTCSRIYKNEAVYKYKVNITLYECQNGWQDRSTMRGSLFGGVFDGGDDGGVVNPYTGEKSCPSNYDFKKVPIGINSYACLAPWPIGGVRDFATTGRLTNIFSCHSPLKSYSCPTGFSKHLAFAVPDGPTYCQVYYCARLPRNMKLRPIRRPPYTSMSHLTDVPSSSTMLYGYVDGMRYMALRLEDALERVKQEGAVPASISNAEKLAIFTTARREEMSKFVANNQHTWVQALKLARKGEEPRGSSSTPEHRQCHQQLPDPTPR